MRVKLLARWASPEFNHPEGTEVDLDEAQARQLVADRHAEPLDPIPAEQAKKGRGGRRSAAGGPASAGKDSAPDPEATSEANAETKTETEATTEAE